jgi:hypothetical protein
VTESEETNNITTRPITVVANWSDLVVQTINAPDSVVPGQNYRIYWTIINQGAGRAYYYGSGYGWYDEVYLSTDDQLGGGDVYLGRSYCTSLNAGSI